MDKQTQEGADLGFGKNKIIVAIICAVAVAAAFHFLTHGSWKEWFRGIPERRFSKAGGR